MKVPAEPLLRMAARAAKKLQVKGERFPAGATSAALDRDGKPHEILLSRSELVADYKWFERWASYGFNTPSSVKGKAILRAELLEAKCDKRVRLVPRTGWYGSIFVLPTVVYGASSEVYRVIRARPEACSTAQRARLMNGSLR